MSATTPASPTPPSKTSGPSPEICDLFESLTMGTSSDFSLLDFTPEPVEPRPRRWPYRKTSSKRRVHFEPGRGGPPLPFIPACKCKSGSGILKRKCDRFCGIHRSPRSATFNSYPISDIFIIPARGPRGILKSAGSRISKTKPLKLSGILKTSVETPETPAPRLRRTVAFKQPLRTIYEIPSDEEEEDLRRIFLEPRFTAKKKGLGLIVKAVDEYDMCVLEERLSDDRESDSDSDTVTPIPVFHTAPLPDERPLLDSIEVDEEVF